MSHTYILAGQETKAEKDKESSAFGFITGE